jgi:hypothetical protein
VTLQALDKFHKTRRGYLVFGLVELAMSYGFASWALSGGNLLDWALTFILLFGAAQNFVQAAKVHKK